MKVRRGVLGLVVAAVLLSGCSLSSVTFATDERVVIRAPRANASVQLPLEVTWSVAPSLQGRYLYAVVFDRAPMRPGSTTLGLVAAGDPCRTQRTCPDATWLSDHYAYVVDGTSVRVTSLPDLRTNHAERDKHEVTIVLLDRTSKRRVGQLAWTRELYVDRG
jgi:hypothetical protein